MPLLRYFTFVGGALLALLIVVSSYFLETETIPHRDVASRSFESLRLGWVHRASTSIPVCNPRSFPHRFRQFCSKRRRASRKPNLAHRSRHLLQRLSRSSARRRGAQSDPTAREWLPTHKDSSLSI